MILDYKARNAVRVALQEVKEVFFGHASIQMIDNLIYKKNDYTDFVLFCVFVVRSNLAEKVVFIWKESEC